MNVLANYKIILRPENLNFNLPLKLNDNTRNELEIGFGNGEYTVNYALNHPEIMLYGFEMSYSCVMKCARRAGNIKNLKILRADAQVMLREVFDYNSLDKIYMNFPCPWPKRRHAEKRVISGNFAENLSRVLKLNGIFELVTDDKNYADETRESFIKNNSLSLKIFEINPVRQVTTKYERKWLEQGKDIYRLIFEKISKAEDEIYKDENNKNKNNENENYKNENNREEFFLMLLNEKRPVTEDFLKSLNGVSGHDDDGAYWSFGRYYSGNGAFLLEAFAADGDFKQRYYIRFYDGKFQLDATASAFMTPAVKNSLKNIRDIYEGYAANVGACASGAV